MDLDLAQLSNLWNPDRSYAGQQSKVDTENVMRDRIIAEAAAQRQQTQESAQLAPYKLAQEKFKASPEMLSAELKNKNAVSGYNEALTAQTWNKLEESQQTQIIAKQIQVQQQMANTGQQIAIQGGTGEDAYQQLKQHLTTQLQSAKSPEMKKTIQQSLVQLDTMAEKHKMRQWTSQQLMQQSTQMQEVLARQDPKNINEKIKSEYDLILEKQRGANQKDVANIYANARGTGGAAGGYGALPGGKSEADYLKARPSVRYSTSRSAIESGMNPFTHQPLTEQEKIIWQQRVAADTEAMNAELAKGTGGKADITQYGVQTTPMPTVGGGNQQQPTGGLEAAILKELERRRKN